MWRGDGERSGKAGTLVGGFLDEWSCYFGELSGSLFFSPVRGPDPRFLENCPTSQQIIMANHRGTHFGQMSSVFLANCPRTLGGGHFGIEWFLALSARFLAICPTWGGCGGFLDEWSCYFGELSGSLFPRPGSGSPFFGKLSDFTSRDIGRGTFGQMSSFFWELNSVVDNFPHDCSSFLLELLEL